MMQIKEESNANINEAHKFIEKMKHKKSKHFHDTYIICLS